ncbi:MAG TPA: ComEC/Rec2 family competence protein [Methanocorpusculum sp.]|nr:ComEC/Rec2 family competence protein [Methanocorpusculum sp.]
MAQKKSRRNTKANQKKQKTIITSIIIIALIVIFGGAGINGGFETILGSSGTYSIPSSIQITDPAALSVHVINVGQADCILLSKDGKYALVDAGKSNQKNDIDSTAAITSYLNALGVKQLEFILITHQDYDHIGSAKTVLSAYPAKVYYDNGFIHTSATYEKLMTYLDEENIPCSVVTAGDTITSPWKGVTIKVLSPPKEYLSDDVNDNSAVIKVTYGTVSYLLTGDATTETEEYIISTGADIDADILKAGHHGSYSSSSSPFLKAVSPTVSVISVGDENSYGHPHKDALKRLNKYTKYLYRTDIDGTVVISSDGSAYSVKTENNLPYSAAAEFVTGSGEAVYA